MRREVSEQDLAKKYKANDMVRADCNGCEGCSACCQGMGESVILDPMDIARLASGLGISQAQLLQSALELHVSDGVILPNMKMAGEEEKCCFLNEEGRCRVHAIRPGVCRLFPLGRIYEEGGFSYFLQHQECPKPVKSKVKIIKWIDTPGLKQYESYILRWHELLEAVRELLEKSEDEQLARDINSYLLQNFYLKEYPASDFYAEFEVRRESFQKLLKVLSAGQK
ncbi:MAG: YkgJ family cysteine cluster protein [Eubacteriales bacterium]|nr:YkgJ family cysteine cluster protein [Eubacteriales bacterium]